MRKNTSSSQTVGTRRVQQPGFPLTALERYRNTAPASRDTSASAQLPHGEALDGLGSLLCSVKTAGEIFTQLLVTALVTDEEHTNSLQVELVNL